MFDVPYMPPDLSEHGGSLDGLNNWVHTLMLVLFVGWGLFFIYTLFRFRAGKNTEASYAGVQSHMSSYLEVGVALIECLLLFALALPAWSRWIDVGQDRAPAAGETAPGAEAESVTEIRVVAQQFAWNVQYPGPDGKFGKLDVKEIDESLNPLGVVGLGLNDPDSDPEGQDDIVTLNDLRVPVDRKVRITVTTKDVIHSFWLPVLRVKQDCIPGESIPVGFTAKKTSAQFKQDFAAERPEKCKEIRARTIWKEAEADRIAAAKVEAGAAPPAARHPNVKTFEDALKQADTEGSSPQILASWVPDFQIACAQLCGAQHFKMAGMLKILSGAEFDAFVGGGN